MLLLLVIIATGIIAKFIAFSILVVSEMNNKQISLTCVALS